MANVGKNIRILRKQKNITQDDLAKQLYVSRQTVSNYENGKSNPDIDMLVKIAEALGADVHILIFGIPVSPSRRKEWIRLLTAAGIFLLSGLLLLYLSPRVDEWKHIMYDVGPEFFLDLLLAPAVCLSFGWMLMQGLFVFWGIKRQNRKEMEAVCYLTAAFLLFYLILTLPFCVERLYVSFWLYQRSQLHQSLEIREFLPNIWEETVIRLWYGQSALRFVFPLAGMVLWNGKGGTTK